MPRPFFFARVRVTLREERRLARHHKKFLIDRDVLLHLVDLDRKAAIRPRERPLIRNLHAVGIAVIRIIDLRGIAAQRSLREAHLPQQQAGGLVEIKLQGRLVRRGRFRNHQVCGMAVDFFAGLDAEVLIQFANARGEIKLRVDARGLPLRSQSCDERRCEC